MRRYDMVFIKIILLRRTCLIFIWRKKWNRYYITTWESMFFITTRQGMFFNHNTRKWILSPQPKKVCSFIITWESVFLITKQVIVFFHQNTRKCVFPHNMRKCVLSTEPEKVYLFIITQESVFSHQIPRKCIL